MIPPTLSISSNCIKVFFTHHSWNLEGVCSNTLSWLPIKRSIYISYLFSYHMESYFLALLSKIHYLFCYYSYMVWVVYSLDSLLNIENLYLFSLESLNNVSLLCLSHYHHITLKLRHHNFYLHFGSQIFKRFPDFSFPNHETTSGYLKYIHSSYINTSGTEINVGFQELIKKKKFVSGAPLLKLLSNCCLWETRKQSQEQSQIPMWLFEIRWCLSAIVKPLEG